MKKLKVKEKVTPVIIKEGHIQAVQDITTPGMWYLYVERPKDGFPVMVQWMSTGNIQNWFEAEIPENVSKR